MTKKNRRKSVPDISGSGSKDRVRATQTNARKQRKNESIKGENMGAKPRVKSVADEIEEQLQKQRQKKQRESKSQTELIVNKKRLGGYIYDEKRKSYFPAQYMEDESKRRKAELKSAKHDVPESLVSHKTFYNQFCSHPVQPNRGNRNPSFALMYAAEICGNPFRRQHLIDRWRGSYLLETMSFEFPMKNPHYGRICPERCTLQRDYPTWIRTFDVVPHVHQPPAFFVVKRNQQIHFQEWPDIVAQTNEHLFTEGDHVKYMQSSDGSIRRIGTLRFAEGHTQFLISQVGHPLGIELRIDREVNDFALLYRHSRFIVAGRKKYVLLCETDGFVPNGLGLLHRKGIPESDALCVETDCSTAESRPHTVVYGHRNGQVSMHDIRSNACGSTAPMGKDSGPDSFGSVVELELLFAHHPDQLLAKGDQGNCRLFDLRKLSSLKPRKMLDDPCLVHSFRIPNHLQTLRPPMRTKGLATDPKQTVLFLPYFDNENSANLAISSIATGEFAGTRNVSKELQKKGLISRGDMVEKFELSHRSTAAWTVTKSHASRGEDTVKASPSSFALWANTGATGIVEIIGPGKALD
jgi:hypothetical protein